MGNISNYLSWRGDLDFREHPFSEVDSLVLSVLAGLDLDGIVPARGSGEKISVKAASEKFYIAGDISDLKDEDAESILFRMAQSTRYRDAMLMDYVRPEGETPFSALTIALGDGTSFIGFARGLSTLDDLKLVFDGCSAVSSAHREAVRYAEEVLSRKSSLCRIGGALGGGTLALYAACLCREDLKPAILMVYSADGPGPAPDLLPPTARHLLSSRSTILLPEYSVIGTLFTPDTRPLIVKSSARGLLQCSPMTWQVESDHFVTVRRHNRESAACSEILDGWIESSSQADRTQFISDLFGALKLNGAKTLEDITGSGIDGFYTVLRSLTTSEKRIRIVAGSILNSFFAKVRVIRPVEVMSSTEALFALALLALGLVLVFAPETSFLLIGRVVCAVVLIFSMIRLLMISTREMNPTQKRRLIILYMLLLCASSGIGTNLSRLTLVTGLIVGALFIGIALILLVRLIRTREMTPANAALGILALILAAIGVVCASASDLLAGRSGSLGFVLVLISLILFVHAVVRNAELHAGGQL